MISTSMDFSSLYAGISSYTDLFSNTDSHLFCSSSNKFIYDVNITYPTPDKRDNRIIYNSPLLKNKIESLSSIAIDKNLSIVTILDTYENICDFLNNDSIYIFAYTKIEPHWGDFKYTLLSRKREKERLAITEKWSEFFGCKSTFFGNLGVSIATKDVSNSFSVLENHVYHEPYSDDNYDVCNLDIGKNTTARATVTLALTREYKVNPTKYYTTVIFYGKNSCKVFCDTSIDVNESRCLTCKDVLEFINKKEEN